MEATDSSGTAARTARTFRLTVGAAPPPALTLATTATAQLALAADVTLTSLTQPLERVALLVAFATRVLQNSRAVPGAAAEGARLSLELLAAGLVQVDLVGPPGLAQPGHLLRLEFECLETPGDRPGLVTLVSSELETATGRIRRLRPVAQAGPDQVVRVRFLPGGGIDATGPDALAPAGANLRAHVRLDGRASGDANRPARALSYAWSRISSPAVTLSDPAAPTPAFVPAREGEYRFGLVVSNGELSSPAVDTRVVVEPANVPPAAEAIVEGRPADGVFIAGRDRVVLDGTLSTDPDSMDARTLTHAWRQVSGPPVTLLDASGERDVPSAAVPRVRFVPASPGRHAFELVVTDQTGFASPPTQVEVVARSEGSTTPNLSLQASATTTQEQGDDLGNGAGQKPVRSLRLRIPTRVTLRALVADPEVGR